MISPDAADKPARRSSSPRWNPSFADVSRLGENCYFYAMRGEVRPAGARAPVLVHRGLVCRRICATRTRRTRTGEVRDVGLRLRAVRLERGACAVHIVERLCQT